MNGERQRREWDWVFSSLWIACGKNNTGYVVVNGNDADNNHFLTHPWAMWPIGGCRCLLNIPQTVLLKDGEPRRWLGTTEYGHITRVSFGKAPKRKKGKNDRAVHRMKIVRAAFVEASRAAGNKESDPLCVAWYLDKGKELLDLKTLDMLLRHEEWRVQVLALQSYVKPKELHHGDYRRGSSETGKHPSERVSTMDTLAQSMSQYAETAYANLEDLSEMEDPVISLVILI
jgi:hypothetical protein